MPAQTRRAKPWSPQARSDVPTYVLILQTGFMVGAKRPRSRPLDHCCRALAAAQARFPAVSVPVKPKPYCEAGLRVHGAMPSLRNGGRQAHAFDFRRGKVEFKAEIVVLGAGMVGVCAALHLQQRGRDVILVDKHELAGEETSYGNAGLIERASVFPYMFPRDFSQILRYALNRAPQVRYAVADLPEFLPWLVRYYLASSPERALHSAMAELPLIRRSLIEHEALIGEAGVPQLLRKTGWIKLFRSEATLKGALHDRDRAKQYGVEGETLDSRDIAEREPALTGDFAGGIYWPTPC